MNRLLFGDNLKWLGDASFLSTPAALISPGEWFTQ
jgi:hypothetical protein